MFWFSCGAEKPQTGPTCVPTANPIQMSGPPARALFKLHTAILLALEVPAPFWVLTSKSVLQPLEHSQEHEHKGSQRPGNKLRSTCNCEHMWSPAAEARGQTGAQGGEDRQPLTEELVQPGRTDAGSGPRMPCRNTPPPLHCSLLDNTPSHVEISNQKEQLPQITAPK